MADPTLKDVLHAVEALAKNAATKADLTELKEDLARLDAKVTKGFADLDQEIEKDIAALKRRPPRSAARPARRR